MAQMSASDAAAAAASGGGGGDDGSEGAMGAAARREAAVAAAGFERAAEQAADALVAATGNDLAAATERLLAAHRRAAASLGQQQQQQQQSPLRSDADVRQAQVKLSKEHKLYSAVAVRLFILKTFAPFPPTLSKQRGRQCLSVLDVPDLEKREMSGLYQDRLRTGSWTSRQCACDIP